MSIFRGPEFATSYGALDDECVADGEPVSAHVLRELCRNGNYLTNRGGFVFRWLGKAVTATEQGRALGYAPPFWRHIINVPQVPVYKPYRINQLRCRFRIVVTSGTLIQLFVGTTVRPSPEGTTIANVATVIGTGSVQVVDLTVNCREAPGELLSFYVKGLTDPGNDAAMVTATYGSPNTGTVSALSNSLDTFQSVGATWNTSGNMVHNGGHYVYFTNSTGGTHRHGPAEVRAVVSATQLAFWPPVNDLRALNGTTFTIRKLPDIQLQSIAVYGITRNT